MFLFKELIYVFVVSVVVSLIAMLGVFLNVQHHILYHTINHKLSKEGCHTNQKVVKEMHTETKNRQQTHRLIPKKETNFFFRIPEFDS